MHRLALRWGLSKSQTDVKKVEADLKVSGSTTSIQPPCLPGAEMCMWVGAVLVDVPGGELEPRVSGHDLLRAGVLPRQGPRAGRLPHLLLVRTKKSHSEPRRASRGSSAPSSVIGWWVDGAVVVDDRVNKSKGGEEEEEENGGDLSGYLSRFTSPKKANRHIILYSERRCAHGQATQVVHGTEVMVGG